MEKIYILENAWDYALDVNVIHLSFILYSKWIIIFIVSYQNLAFSFYDSAHIHNCGKLHP